MDDGRAPRSSYSQLCVSRQRMLRALAELFAVSPDQADVEASTTIRALQQMAILLTGARA
jgi:hypothetical protein